MSRKNSKGGKKRLASRYPGLHRDLHPKTRWEYLDGDYYDDLSEDHKEFMSKFNEEYYGASLAKADAPETWEKDFHDTQALRKECTDRNNARNRDLYTILRTRGMIDKSPEQMDNGNDVILEATTESFVISEVQFQSKENMSDRSNQEDILIEALDLTLKNE